MKKVVLGLAVLAYATAQSAHADTSKYDRLAREGDNYVLSWNERNGEIIYDTVCQQNKKRSIQYRNCRRDAQFMFRDKCNESEVRPNKWCLAKTRYFP